ncbi:MAG: ABC transporter ATP-binding protein [Pseudomonadales bacterium]
MLIPLIVLRLLPATAHTIILPLNRACQQRHPPYNIAMNFYQLLQFITPHRNTLVLVLVLLLTGSVISLSTPWVAGLLTGHILGETNNWLPSLPWILGAWFALLVVKSLLGFTTSYLIGTTGETMLAKLRTRLYDHIQLLPMQYYQEQRRGDVLALLSNDAEIISRFVTSTLVQLLPLLLTFFGALILMAWLSPTIAGLALLLLPLYYLAMKIISRKIRPLSTAWVQSWSDMISFVEENLGLLPAIKAFTREPLEAERFGDKNSQLLGLSKQQILIQSLLGPMIGLLAGAGLLLLLWLGSSQLEQGLLTAPQLVSLLLYAMLLNQPLSGLANVYGQIMNTRGAANRLIAFLAEQPEPVDIHHPDLALAGCHIIFDKISFAYPGRDPILTDYTLDIKPGETIALTGPNGAGKSTLAHLLMRLADVDQGQITIDGTDIRQVNLASLRAQIGLVAQHTLLLNGSVADNIAYGRAMASQDDIEDAAKGAHADEFISQLPDGYQTVIGDQGLKLSGGQRQRIALARALLKNSPILILDEATSMFDPEGEANFIAQCHELLHQRTVILITHRPASLALADRIISI